MPTQCMGYIGESGASPVPKRRRNLGPIGVGSLGGKHLEIGARVKTGRHSACIHDKVGGETENLSRSSRYGTRRRESGIANAWRGAPYPGTACARRGVVR